MPKVSGTIYRKGIQRCLDVPKTALSLPPKETRPPVIATIGSLTFESTLLPRDARNFQLVVPVAILRKIGRDAGQRVELVLHHDKQREAPPVPSELINALRTHPLARNVFNLLSVAKKREIVRFIDSARGEATRLTRAETVVTRLLSWKTKG